MMNYTDEEHHQITLEEYYEGDIKPNLFAVSRIFAEARKQMTLPEYKTFTLGLSKIDWTKPCPDTIYLEKKELAKVLGITSDTNHLSQDLKRAIGQMPHHSYIEFDDKGKDYFVSGNFIRTLALFKNKIRIKIEEEFLGLFGQLDGKTTISKYITMLSTDIFDMKSDRAVKFYELLRDNSDTRLDLNSGTVSIRKFKEMYNIPKDGKGSYMREKGGFDRKNFESRVIDPICEELQKTEMITLVLTPEGKYYEKIKKGGRVIAYKFYWTLKQDKPKRQIEAPEDAETLEIATQGLKKKDEELWVAALSDLKLSDEEIEAVGVKFRLITAETMEDNGINLGNIELDRYHMMSMLVSELKVSDAKKHIRSKYKYLITMINKYL